jgi:NADP-dependent aldehyde dehydrogenase
MQQTITGAQLIGFEESASSPKTFRSMDPSTANHTPWKFHEATEQEIDQAMELAANSFVTYKNTSGKARGAFLRAIAARLEERSEDLVQVYTLESGLPAGRAKGELGRTTGQLRAFAALAESGSWVEARIDTALPDRKPVPRPDIRKCLVPLGPVVVFGASNFPFAFSTAGGDTASALAVGCPVVVKGHPLHAGTGEAVGRCIQHAARETGMPAGVFSHLQGSGNALGEKLVKHPATRAVGFTGSQKGGLALARIGAERTEPIPVFAEMGSINPVVVLPSALDPSRGWATAYAQSVTLGAGQFCTNPGLILGVAGEAWENFTTALAIEIGKLPAACMLHPGMAEAFRALRAEFLSQTGVRSIQGTGKEASGALVGGAVAGVSGEDFRQNPLLQREVFGPFTLTVACQDKNELLEIIKGLEGQLTASLLGEEAEIEAEPELLEALQGRVGRLLFNGVPTGVEVCPSMHHGGPFPATTDARFTSVGLDAFRRWVKPLALQNAPATLLPDALRDENPLGIWRTVNGEWTRDSI